MNGTPKQPRPRTRLTDDCASHKLSPWFATCVYLEYGCANGLRGTNQCISNAVGQLGFTTLEGIQMVVTQIARSLKQYEKIGVSTAKV